MSDTFVFPPLDEGAPVATDILVAGSTREQAQDTAARLGELTNGDVDLVLIVVPAGEGCAVELAVLRALRVQAAPAAEKETPR